jgi:hypothetical protein
MQRSGQGAPSVHDLLDLRDVVARDELFVTVWASRPALTPRSIASRVQEVRDAVHGGWSDRIAEQLAGAVDSAFPESAGVVAVADRSGVVLSEPLSEPPRADIVRVASLPSLAPVIEHRQQSIPFLAVVADRRGADVFWSTGGQTGTTTVAGDDTTLTKVQAGGWSQRTFQQRAENSWEHTAHDIADELTRLTDSVNPRLITVAGDVRIKEMLHKRLPASTAALLRDAPGGGRTPDGSEDDRADVVRRWVRTAVAEDTIAVLDLFEQHRGQLDRASDGAAATFEAMREARVDTLLIHDDPSSERAAYFVADDPSVVALERLTIRDLGHAPARAGRMVDVAIRNAILTGAGIRIMPAGSPVNDGIGAILRW